MYAVIRGACEGLGMCTLMKDMGTASKVRMHLDASAAKCIIERKGLDVDVLWLQEQQARRLLPLVKVDGVWNPADLMTKHLGADKIEAHMRMMRIGVQDRKVRASSRTSWTR